MMSSALPAGGVGLLQRMPYLLAVGAFVLAYFFTARLGLLLAIEPGSASPVWPPSGLAVAVLLRFGLRLWPGILIGEFAAVVWDGLPPAVALGMGAGNVLEAAIAVTVLHRFGQHPQEVLQHSRDLAVLLAGALAGGMVSASCGVGSLHLGGVVPAGAVGQAWLTWLLGDVTGIVLFGALLLSWFGGTADPRRLRMTESTVIASATILLAFVFFSGLLPTQARDYPLVFVLLPLLVVGAFRSQQRFLTLLVTLMTGIAIVGTAAGMGPFARPDLNVSMLLLQGYIGILATTALFLSAVLVENARAADALRAHRNQLQQRFAQTRAEWNHAMDFLDNGICIIGTDRRIIRSNRAFSNLLGHSGPVTGMLAAGALASDQDGSSRLQQMIFNRREELLYLDAEDPDNPTSVPLEVASSVVRDDQGQDIGLLVSLHDQSHARQIERELGRLNDHLRLLMESADEGIVGIDAQGCCSFVNSAAARMLDHPAGALRGQPASSIIAAANAVDGAARDLLEPTLARGVTQRADEAIFRRRGGQLFPVSCTLSPIIENHAKVGAVLVFRDVTEERAMARRMDFLASHDALTGLYNRVVFERHLERAISGAIEEGRQHTLCYVDLDQFKVVNDTCGHIAGDELLRQIADLLGRKVRRSDILARLGGDEFGILFDSCELAQATDLIDDLLNQVREYRFSWDGRTFAIGASIGVVEISADTPSLAAAMSAADSACYVAKDAGRNRAHVYQEDDQVMARRRGEMHWVSRLHEALDQDKLFLEGQRIFALDDKADGLAIEMLVRMRGEDGRSVPPGAFIPAAERYNVMGKIDRWVISEVFGWLNTNADDLEHLTLCTINLSGASVGSEEFLAELLRQAKTLQVPQHKICFEVTETAAVANLSAAARFVRELKAEGFRFALDDFGSGMSSFAYLKNLPVDIIKIDGNFVRDIASDQIDHAMVSAINDVGHVMGLRTVAEFVESPEVLATLRGINIDYGQGFHLHRPQALDQLLTRH